MAEEPGDTLNASLPEEFEIPDSFVITGGCGPPDVTCSQQLFHQFTKVETWLQVMPMASQTHTASSRSVVLIAV